MLPKALPYSLFLGSLWGTNLVMSRFGVGQFDAFLFVGLRLLIATFTFAIFFQFSEKRSWSRNKQVWRRSVPLGVWGTAIPMFCFIGSLQYQSSGVTSVLVTAAPAVTTLIAHFLLPDEKMSWGKGVGVALALSGSIMLIALGETGLDDVNQANPLGYGMVFAGLVVSALSAVYIRTNMQGMDSFEVTGIRLLSATVVAVPFALLWRGVDLSQVTTAGILSLLYAALVGAFAAQILGFYVTRQFGATAFAVSSYITPVVGTGLGAALLGEKVTLGMGGGLVLIVAGIALINRISPREMAPTAG